MCSNVLLNEIEEEPGEERSCEREFGVVLQRKNFFEDDNGHSVFITSEQYVQMIDRVLFPQITEKPEINLNMCFQQAGVITWLLKYTVFRCHMAGIQ